MGLPQRFHARAFGGADDVVGRIAEGVGRVEIDDAVGIDGVEQVLAVAALVNLYRFFNLEDFLAGIGHFAILGVEHRKIVGRGEHFKREAQREI